MSEVEEKLLDTKRREGQKKDKELEWVLELKAEIEEAMKILDKENI